MSKFPLHTFFIEIIAEYLKRIVPAKFIVRQEAPISTFDSEPEPDISIVEGPLENYYSEHPKTAILVIEIAITSLELDRAKALVDAEANVPEYWILRPDAKSVEIYTEAKDGQYLSKKEQSFDDRLVVFGKEVQLTSFLPKK